MSHLNDFRCRLLAVLLAVVWTASCMPDIEQDDTDGPPAQRVQPVLDSEAQTLPLPNDLALDQQGTLPDLPGSGEETAQGEFLSWLSTLHGWLPETDIEVPFNGRLDQETVTTDALHLYDTSGEEFREIELESVDYREESVRVTGADGEPSEVDGSVLTLNPAEEIVRDGSYAVIVTKQLAGADGEPIQEPRPIFFALSREPLVDDNDQSTIESLTNEQARQLESIRQSLQPIVEGAIGAEDDDELTRDDMAMIFGWSTLPDPMTRLEPETGTVPLPNTAALEEDGTFPAEQAFDNVGGENAQGYFNAYLDGLHGWPPTSPITLPIDGAINPETVEFTRESNGDGDQQRSENVQVWAMAEDGSEAERIMLDSVSYDAEQGTVTVTPSDPLPQRRRYVAFATDDVENQDGLSLKLPAALQMAIQPYDVLEDGSSTVDRLSDEQAQAIAGLRQFLRPAATFLDESTDTSADEIGAIWTWQTWTDTFAVFDPETQQLPFPNEFLRTGEMGGVQLPTEGLGDLEAPIVEELNRRFGFSTTAAGWVPFAGPIEEASLEEPLQTPEKGDDPVQFLWLEPGASVYEPSRYTVDFREEWSRLTYTPDIPWKRDANLDTNPDPALPLNVGIINDSLMGGNGHPVQPSPAFVFLRSPHSLTDDEGNSTVEQLDDATAQRLEEPRTSFNTLLQFGLSAQGLNAEEREDIALAWPFHPENPQQYLQEFHAQAEAKLGERGTLEAERACQQEGCTPENAPDMPNVDQVQWGAEFDTVEFLADDGTMRTYDEASAEPVGISVFVPAEGQDCSRPFEVALMQHGFTSSRIQSAPRVADALAAECVATVAMDLPAHGGRTPGTEGLHPTTTPENSGAMFFTNDLVVSLNRLIQGIVDLAVLAEYIESGGLETAIDDAPGTDWFAEGGDTQIGFVGHSLGGFAGYPLATIDPSIGVGVFANIGGKYSRVLTEGELDSALGDALPAEGTFERFRGLSLVQWLADIVDPFAYSPYIGESPAFEPANELERLNYDPDGGSFSYGNDVGPNEVLLQMTENQENMDDPIVPNATTELLAESTGASLDNSTFTGSHSLLLEPGGEQTENEADCMRRQAAQWVATGLQDGESMLLEPSNCPSGQ
jgi:hypothetical protein